MKQYTKEEFDNFPVIDGRKQCPSGDYTLIRSFGEGCSFGERCIFGKRCSFGERCIFGEWCSFGERCIFGKRCSFGERCRFGEWCSFDECCRFGESCSFGERCRFGECCSFDECCSFGEWCSFGERCSFGELCSFGERCSFEKGYQAKFPPFIRVNNIGSRVDGCYIYNFEKGIYVRSGCFFGTEQEFTQAVEKKHAGTKYETQYKLSLQLAKVTF